MNYFIADLHFGHKNCMSFDNRPFTTIEENDKIIIENWNNVVNIEDDVYILGDISWHNATKTIEIFKSLNGNKHLIVGNHDSKLLRCKELRDCFVEICNYKELYINEKESIILSHYPIIAFKNHYYGWYHLYGHVHIGWENNIINHTKLEMEALYDVPCKMFNVGCMLPYMDYTPKTLTEIVSVVNK